MTDTSRAPDWRNEAEYEYIKVLSDDGRRWEFLRRSDRYRRLFESGRLSNPGIARMNFGIVGDAPAPSTRGCDLPSSFRFETAGERMRIHRGRSVKQPFWPGETVVDMRFDLEASIPAQIHAARIELERLAKGLGQR